MAKYAIGPIGHYRDGRMYRHGEEIVRPDASRPGKDWTPLDDAAKAAKAKFFPDEKPAKAKPPEAPKPPVGTMSEAQKGPRASNREPV